MKEFAKADLRYGYLVVMRSGDKAIYMPSIDGDAFDIDEYGNCLLLKNYDNDLTYTNSKNHDIVKVYGFAHAYETTSFDLKTRGLIWERKEVKRMTAEEMREKLEKLTGEKIEIEPSREEMIGVCDLHCDEYTECDYCCLLNTKGDCDFEEYSIEKLRECYEKVIADGQTEN